MDAKLQHLTDKVLQGEEINRQEAEWLTQIDIEELAQGADRIRQERQQCDQHKRGTMFRRL